MSSLFTLDWQWDIRGSYVYGYRFNFETQAPTCQKRSSHWIIHIKEAFQILLHKKNRLLLFNIFFFFFWQHRDILRDCATFHPSSVMLWPISTKLGQKHYWLCAHMLYEFKLDMTFDLVTEVKNVIKLSKITPPRGLRRFQPNFVRWFIDSRVIWLVHEKNVEGH